VKDEAGVMGDERKRKGVLFSRDEGAEDRLREGEELRRARDVLGFGGGGVRTCGE
jgi:hypothetical protein